jgi:hypothetical protein
MLKLQQKRLISASRIFHRDNFLLDISLQINMHLEKMNSDLFNFQALAVRYSHVKVILWPVWADYYFFESQTSKSLAGPRPGKYGDQNEAIR